MLGEEDERRRGEEGHFTIIFMVASFLGIYFDNIIFSKDQKLAIYIVASFVILLIGDNFDKVIILISLYF